MRVRWVMGALAMAILMAGQAEPRPRTDRPRGSELRSEIIDVNSHIDVNEINMFVTNQGSWAFNKPDQDAGLEWPKDSGNHAVFAGGLWLGAKVNNQVRVTVGEFSQEYAAGPMDSATGLPVDPTETDPKWKVLKLNAGDNATSNPDYQAWLDRAAELGRDGPPVRVDTTTHQTVPVILGDQTLWCVYNDAVAGKHTNQAGNSPPLGVEVRQTTFAFQRTGALGKTIFIDLEIENKGSNVLQDMFVSIWYDPDLGGFTDDLVGCDTTLSLGYVYNATNNDGEYGAHPPTMGCDFFLGPVSAGDTLGMTSFNKYINGTDPSSSQETYNYMQGLDLSGAPQQCNGVNTTFVLTGDPVHSTGCLDSDPADRRFMMTSGPIVMNPGDEQRVVVAIIIGGESGKGDRLSNISLLKFYDQFAQDAFDRAFNLPSPPPQPVVTVTPGDGTINLSWGSESQLNYNEAGYAFEGYNVYQGASASGPWKLIRLSGGPPFDVANGIGIVFEDVFDSESGVIINRPVQFGSDAGVKHSIDIDQDFIRTGHLHNGITYYYAVTAYAIGLDQTPNNLENAIVAIPAVPQREVSGVDLDPVATGAVTYSAAISDTIPPATNVVTVETVQPSRVTGHTYKVVFTPVTPFDVSIDNTTHHVTYVWNVVDTSVNPPDTVLANQFNLTGNDDYQVVDGVRVKVRGVYFPQIQDIAYVNVPPNRRALTGIAFDGGRFFFGGADTGCRFAGSTFSDSAADTTDFCPGAEVNPDLFYSVDIRFGAPGAGKAYLFHRQELANGDSPDPLGRPYVYDGYVNVPFTAHDLLNNRQLQAMFVEREVVDSLGVPLPPNQQPHPTYDFTWNPDVADSLGGREYINILSVPYSATPDPQFEQDNLFFSGTIPVIYSFWTARRDSSDVIDPGDAIHVTWGNPGDENDVYTFSTIAGVGVADGRVVGDASLARARGDLKQIRVVPNPYLTRSVYERNQFNRVIKFVNLPAECTIRIFDLAGDLVRTLPTKSDPSTSIQEWDLENSFGLPVSSGIYVYHVEAPGIGSTFGKLAVVMEKENLENF